MTEVSLPTAAATTSNRGSNNTPPSRRQTLPAVHKRRKPRRQSGLAVAFENRESVVQKSRLERTDSDKVIRRNSMARKLSLHNTSMMEGLMPEEYLNQLKDLDASLTRMSLVAVARRNSTAAATAATTTTTTTTTPGNSSRNRPTLAVSSLVHGPEFTETQLQDMSEQALLYEDSEESIVSEIMEDDDEETMEDL